MRQGHLDFSEPSDVRACHAARNARSIGTRLARDQRARRRRRLVDPDVPCWPSRYGATSKKALGSPCKTRAGMFEFAEPRREAGAELQSLEVRRTYRARGLIEDQLNRALSS